MGWECARRLTLSESPDHVQPPKDRQQIERKDECALLSPSPQRFASRDTPFSKPFGCSSPVDASVADQCGQPGVTQARESVPSLSSPGPANRVSRDTFLSKPFGCSSPTDTRPPSQGTRARTAQVDEVAYPQSCNPLEEHSDPLSPTPSPVARWFQAPSHRNPANPRPAVTHERVHQQGAPGIRSPAVLVRVAPPRRAQQPVVGENPVPVQSTPSGTQTASNGADKGAHTVRSPAILRTTRHPLHTPAMEAHPLPAPPCSLPSVFPPFHPSLIHPLRTTLHTQRARHMPAMPPHALSRPLPSVISPSHPTPLTFPSLGSSGSAHRGAGIQSEPTDSPLLHCYPPHINPTENSDTVVHTFFCKSLPAPRHATVDIPSLQPPSPVLPVPTGPALGAGR